MKRSPLLAVALACLVVGAALMLAFESTLARVIGMPLLIAFIICGLFVIADPDDLGDDHAR